MGWQVLTGFTVSGRPAKSLPITLSGTAQGRQRPRLCVTIRPRLIEGAEAWVAGAAVEAVFGTRDHAGQVRLLLSGGGAFRLRSIGRRASDTVSLLLPWPEGVAPVKHPAVPVTHEAVLSGGALALLLRLPGWALPDATGVLPPPQNVRMDNVRMAPAPEAPPAPAVPPRTRSGYVSPSDRLPDPAAADRLAAKQGGEIRA